MSLAVRLGKALDRHVYARMRDPRAAEVTSGEPGTFEELRSRKYALLVTFKRDGQAVPTPIWFGLGGDGTVYTRTFSDAWKVKRISRNPRVLLTPCNVRGKPLGRTIEGRARALPTEDWEGAEQAIAANYSLGRKLYLAPARGRNQGMTYLEITPASA